MKVQTVGGFDGPIHVFGDDAFAKPLAGPFASGLTARLWIVEHIEKGLSAAQLAIWSEVAAQLPVPTDGGLELALIGLVAHGLPREKLAKYVPTAPLPRGPGRWDALDRRQESLPPDHRMAAAGERP